MNAQGGHVGVVCAQTESLVVACYAHDIRDRLDAGRRWSGHPRLWMPRASGTVGSPGPFEALSWQFGLGRAHREKGPILVCSAECRSCESRAGQNEGSSRGEDGVTGATDPLTSTDTTG